MHSYLFVRKDLDWPQIAVQVGHACAEMARQYLDPWDMHPNMVLIGIRSESKLKSVAEFLAQHNVRYAKYHDRKMGQDTAIATEPVGEGRRSIFSKFRILKQEMK